MKPDIIYPKIRFPIDIRLEKIENEEIILINCPIGISKAPLALVPAVGPILSCFDGTISVKDILEKFSPHGLTKELLDTLITLLDDNLFLASARFFEAQNTNVQEFKNAKIRPAALAGRAYPKSVKDLEVELGRYLDTNKISFQANTKQMRGLVAPHIDYRRGQITYGKTYNIIKDRAPDLYVLIGTAHQYGKNIFHLCSKDFDSPFGLMTCDQSFMKNLANKYGAARSYEEEILHKQEHSLELQVPFIKKLNPDTKIAPVLVGSFHHMLQSGKLPQQFEEYDKFADSLAGCVKEYQASGKKVCFLAGVDMAHVGMSFGDTIKLTPEKMDAVAVRDKMYLDSISAQDKNAMFKHIEEDLDERRICGFPTMYTVLDCFDRLGIKYECETFEYRQAVDYQTDCAVTFAGMGIYS